MREQSHYHTEYPNIGLWKSYKNATQAHLKMFTSFKAKSIIIYTKDI